MKTKNVTEVALQLGDTLHARDLWRFRNGEGADRNWHRVSAEAEGTKITAFMHKAFEYKRVQK